VVVKKEKKKKKKSENLYALTGKRGKVGKRVSRKVSLCNRILRLYEKGTV